jgi:hypothetical protein
MTRIVEPEHQKSKVFLLLFFQKKKILLFLKKKKQKDFYFWCSRPTREPPCCTAGQACLASANATDPGALADRPRATEPA